MALERYLKNNGTGRMAEQLPTTVGGTGKEGKIVATDETTGRLDLTLMPEGMGPDVKLLECSEDIAAGKFVNVFNDAGTPKVRLAIADVAGKEADGFVLEGKTSGQTTMVYFEGPNTQLSALTPGTEYFLSASVPGGVDTAAPSASGNVVQSLGKSVSTSEINFEAGRPIIVVA